MSKFINKPFDDDFCFFIQDFIVGDSIIVKGPKRTRVKAIVDKIDKISNEIIYSTKDGSIHNISLNSIVFLDDSRDGWLDGQ